MPKVRTLAPLELGAQTVLPDTILDVSDDVARALRSHGKVTLVEDEERLAAQPGHYTDVMGRDDVAPITPGAAQPGPQSDVSEEQPKPRRSRR